jgi:hypothetical protein
VKGGVHLDLGPKTILYGPNGAGKTATVQSLQLATAGFADDVEGRPSVSLTSSLSRLFSDVNNMYSKAILNDGFEYEWRSMPNGAGGFKEPVTKRPFPVQYPFRETRSALTAGTEKIRSWLEERISGKVSRDDLMAVTPDEHKGAVEFLLKKGHSSDFMKLAEAAKSESRKLKSGATQREKSVERMTHGLPSPLLPSEREALEKFLRDQEPETDRPTPAAPRVSASWAEPSSQAKPDPLQVLRVLLTTHRDHFGMADCKLCGTKPADLSSRLRLIEQALSATPPKAVAPKVTAPSVGLLREKRDQVVRLLAEDSTTARTWNNARAERDSIHKDRKLADQLDEAGEFLSQLGKARLSKMKASYEKSVSSFLKLPGFSVDLISSRVGLAAAGGDLRTALCGGEESEVYMALAAVETSFVQGNSISILIPEDRALDAGTLNRLMTSLLPVDAQVILVSTLPLGLIPRMDGWTYVDVSKRFQP